VQCTCKGPRHKIVEQFDNVEEEVDVVDEARDREWVQIRNA
jgi:hypothetical protein